MYRMYKYGSVKTSATFLQCYVVKGYTNFNNAALAYYIKYNLLLVSWSSVAYITDGCYFENICIMEC